MKTKKSARSLVSVIVILSMIASTLCFGGLSATATAASTNISLSDFTQTNVVLDESGDPNNDGVARKIFIKANSAGGDYTKVLWITASDNKLGFEFGSNKNYKFWAVVKGDKLRTGSISFIAMNKTGNTNTTIRSAIISISGNDNYESNLNNKWTTIDATTKEDTTNYITMSEDVTQVKFQVWINPGSNDKNVYIDSICYAECDATGKIKSGTETEMKLDLLEVNPNMADVSTVTNETYVTDVNNDGQKLKITVPAKSGDTNYTVITNKASFTVVKDRKYQISFYMRSNASLFNANLPMDGVEDYNNAGWNMTNSTDGQWKKYTNTFTAGEKENLSINFWFSNSSASAITLYIDDFAITDITDYSGFEAKGDQVTVSVNTNTNRDGDTDNTSIEITAAAATESAATNVTAEKTITDLEPGKLYSVSMWVKSQDCENGNIYFNNETVKYETIPTKSKTNWTKITRDNVMADDNGNIVVGAWIKNTDTEATCTVWLDEVTVSAQKTLDVQGATIRTKTENQDLMFNLALSTEEDSIVAENWNITEYGMIFVPAQRFGKEIPEGSALTLELAEDENYSKYIIVGKQSVTDGKLPEKASFTLNGSSSTPLIDGGSSCGVKICARAYYKYEYTNAQNVTQVGIIYADNTSTEGSVVTDGVATRSVYGVAKSIGAALLDNDEVTLSEDTKVKGYVDGKFVDENDESTTVTNADILAFVVANIDAVKEMMGVE